ncbi:hypothetical protein A0H81_06993 [Grifola frondosa]|uniref:Uncharacterized protein n=1 Tax=Grifola frondosa TaxID=5627 RepID=A0A1C7M855_GRIFR|nr:hypothetical protein A0H81_06993 [Grifola frondosa]
MAMFVQDFWFGARLVLAGHLSTGAVMAIFWACLIAVSNLQMEIPQLLVLAKGKFDMAALIDLAHSEDEAPQYGLLKITQSPTSSFRGIRPANCRGHLECLIRISVSSYGPGPQKHLHVPAASRDILYRPRFGFREINACAATPTDV